MSQPDLYYRSQYNEMLVLEEGCRCKYIYFESGREYRKEVGTYTSRGMRYDPNTFLTKPTSIEVDMTIFTPITQEQFEGYCFERVLDAAT